MEQLSTLENLGFSLLEHVGDMVCIADISGKVMWASDSFARAYEKTYGAELKGKYFEEFYADFRKSVFFDCFDTLFKTKNPVHRIGFSQGMKSRVGIRGFYVEKFNAFCCHITKLSEVNCVSSYVPLHDPITSLPNRHTLDKDLTLFLQRHVNISCVLLDIERFSLINQSFGFDIGDLLLMEVSSRLMQCKGAGKIYRLNADQFIYLAVEVENHQKDAVMLRKAFMQPFQVDNNKYYLNVKSSGFCLKKADYPSEESTSSIIKKLEIALHYVKCNKGSHVVYSAMMEKNGKRILDLASALKHAIESNQLAIHYQSQIDSTKSKVISAEVLVRWEHPTQGTIGPNEFLPVAKECGLNTKLDRWVISQTFNVCRFIQKDFPIELSINLTADSLSDKSLITFLKKEKEIHGVDPSRIVFEITEDGMMSETKISRETIAQLKNEGFKIAIDDFGVGYSSMSYLMTYPTHYLKLDRIFSANIHKENSQQILVANMAKMAEALGIKMIAEGVESKEQMAKLKELGVEMMQGYYISKPLPIKEFLNHLKEGVMV